MVTGTGWHEAEGTRQVRQVQTLTHFTSSQAW